MNDFGKQCAIRKDTFGQPRAISAALDPSNTTGERKTAMHGIIFAELKKYVDEKFGGCWVVYYRRHRWELRYT